MKIPNKKESLGTTDELLRVFDAHSHEDIETNTQGEVVDTTRLAEVHVARAYIQMLFDLIESKESIGAARTIHLLSDALANLPKLDRHIWPHVETMYEETFHSPIPPRQVLSERDPRETLRQVEQTSQIVERIHTKSLLEKMRGMAKGPAFRSLLFVFALQGMLREQTAHAQTPTHEESVQRIPVVSPEAVERVIEATDSESVSLEKMTEAAPQSQLFEFLSQMNTFDRETISGALSKSVKTYPESWGFSGDATDIEKTEAKELIERRLWELLSVVGNTPRGTDHITLTERKVICKMSREERAGEQTLSVQEQQRYIKAWLETNKDTLAKSGPNIKNLEAFLAEQPAHMREFAALVDRLTPYGFTVFSSGQRNQVDTIWRTATARGLDLTGLDKENIEHVHRIHAQLVAAGVQINLPGHSKHEEGNAIDIAFIGDNNVKLFDSFAREIKRRIDEISPSSTSVKPRLIIERNNGAHGVIHAEINPEEKEVLAMNHDYTD